MIIKTEISGFVMAGGQSSRMGTDKAMLQFEGSTLLSRSIKLIRPFCTSVSVSGQNPDYGLFQLSVIPDIFPGSGPIGGIHSCLEHSSTDWNLVVGVDLPFLNEELIGFLIKNTTGFDCVIPRTPSGIEPLAGLYHHRILPIVTTQIQIGDFKLMHLLEKVNVNFIDCSPLIRKYPRLFTNLNHPEDYNTL